MIGDWKVRVTDNMPLDSDTVIIYRRRPDGATEYIASLGADGETIGKTVAQKEAMPSLVGFAFPKGVLQAIAEHVKPGPSDGEVGRIVEALEVERRRVDMVLSTSLAMRAASWGPATTIGPGGGVGGTGGGGGGGGR